MTSPSPKIEVLLEACNATVGEGPHWDVPTQSLLFVDILSGGLHRWDSVTGKESRINIGGTCSFVIPCDRGGYVVGHDRKIAHLEWDSQKVTPLAEVEQGTQNRFNDAKADASGRLWAGTMGPESTPGVVDMAGAFYSISTDHKVTKQVDNIYISNGMDWTDDNTVMYYIDSVPKKVYAFDFNLQEGTISNQRTAVEFKDDSDNKFGLPDGMCIDNEGKIWVACFSAGRVWRFDPETGKALQSLEFPTTNITSVCFGGKNMDELFVTCSKYKLKSEQPKAGSIFRVTGLGVKGRAPYNYKG